MASIFTYEPETPRVASPWLRGIGSDADIHEPQSTADRLLSVPLDGVSTSATFGETAGKITRLEAEPQMGPVEYKLHLLLRPRRKFRSTSTGSHIPGSRHAKYGAAPSVRSVSESVVESTGSSGSSTPTTITQQSRQHRLEQLTTQLLWRLQQSSPHHASSATNIILPSLPEALPELQAPPLPDKLLHGLEESQGALYEIGVADDGTLVGLAEDELAESLNNLRAMAACLGCTVEVLRKETVGECEWVEDMVLSGKERQVRRSGRLVVAEALVKPCLHINSPSLPPQEAPTNGTDGSAPPLVTDRLPGETEQLRVTLTGPTMSGKSSLLGTLTTSTLDNGRGKSRLSMLKHRHEITTGVTSSVTQELIGYRDASDGAVDVINYAAANIASWIDIHVEASENRLVFISDSAGHPRYRRTTVRSLVGWAPHWTLLCVPADDTEDAAGKTGSTHASQQSLGAAVLDMDLSGAQLELCLKLKLPLVVVITKLDVASRSGLKDSLSRVLSAVKAAGRRPSILANEAGAITEIDLQSITAVHVEAAYQMALPLLNNPLDIVPIVLTSAVQGTGIRNLHALLHELPIPAPLSSSDEGGSAVFHIEDIYTKPAELQGIIVSGRLRTSRICVGETLYIGPFSGPDHLEDSEDSDERPLRRRSAHVPASRSFPGANKDDSLFVPRFFHLPSQEWRRVKVTSIRNLRLPVHSLSADQVGTMAIVLDEAGNKAPPGAAALARTRKGMVLAKLQASATQTFVAQFQREDLEALAVGNHVVVYIASVRASAKIVSTRAPDSPDLPRHQRDGDDVLEQQQQAETDPFSFDDMAETLFESTNKKQPAAGAISKCTHILVTFRFTSAKEYVQVDDQVLVMPGGGPGLYGGHERGEKGLAGLEGFVGRIVETFG